MAKVENLTILYVEDDPAHAEIIERAFNKNIKGQMIHVSDGQEALDYLYCVGKYSNCNNFPRPNMILLDLRLPKVDGLEVLQKIKSDEKLQNIPTIILSTSESENDIAKAYEYHANSYLVKPLDFHKFLNLVESLGTYWLSMNKYSKFYEN